MLKPHIDLIADDDHWRGDIGEFFSEELANEWFESYGNMLLKYATLAQVLNVEVFSVSCELI